MPDLFLPAEARRDILRGHGREHGLDVLIETGTNDGATPWALKDDFEVLYTIELGRRQHRAAVERFRHVPNVHCLQGDSTVVLPQVLGMIDRPALVWLDGHHSGPGTAMGAESTPIRAELAALFDDGRPHVILVDDARCFEGGAEHDLYPHYATYPSLQWVEDEAQANGYDYVLVDDIIRLTPTASR